MDKTDKLIEKYKRDIMNYSARSLYPTAETENEKVVSEKAVSEEASAHTTAVTNEKPEENQLAAVASYEKVAPSAEIDETQKETKSAEKPPEKLSEKSVEKQAEKLSEKSETRTQALPQTDNTEPIAANAQPNQTQTKPTQQTFGSLKVSVYAGNEAFPVESATVEIYDDKGMLLYSLLTDSSGATDVVMLPAPDGEVNNEPGGKKGFAVYSVIASHPEYETEVYDNVQIFDGVESIQPVFFSVRDDFINQTEGE